MILRQETILFNLIFFTIHISFICQTHSSRIKSTYIKNKYIPKCFTLPFGIFRDDILWCCKNTFYCHQLFMGLYIFQHCCSKAFFFFVFSERAQLLHRSFSVTLVPCFQLLDLRVVGCHHYQYRCHYERFRLDFRCCSRLYNSYIDDMFVLCCHLFGK